MRHLPLLLCAVACHSEVGFEPLEPPTPELTLALGDGSLDPAALEPLQAELARIDLHGTEPPQRDHGRWRFQLEVRIETPGGRLGEHSLSDATIRVDPRRPEHPEIEVTLRDGDWPLGAEDAIAHALAATWIGDVLVPPELSPQPAETPAPTRHPVGAHPVSSPSALAPRHTQPRDPEAQPARARTARQPTDVLFVLDDSISMDKVVGRIRRAFTEMTQVNAFPADTRIAVMSTIPGDPLHPGTLHPAVRNRKLALYDPGFLRLVDRGSIAVWHDKADLLTWRHTGCSAWFSPADRDPEGVPCLEAHTQLSRVSVGAEAGLTAFSQLLERTAAPLFREGARAHLVIVSDTHDPGILPTSRSDERNLAIHELWGLRPTGSELARQVEAHERTASFHIHAIAPKGVCTGEKWRAIGPSYEDAARETGGRTLDLCQTGGYAAFLLGALGTESR